MKTRDNAFSLLILLLLAVAILMLSSCRKDDEPEEPIDQPVGMQMTPGQFERTLTINYTLFC